MSALFWFKSSSLKRAVADQAIYAAQASPQVAAQIGLPIEPGWPIRGKVNSRKGQGNADLQIPFNGSRSRGTLYEWAQQTKGKWRLCSLQFTTESDIPLTLIDPANTHCQPE